MESLPDRIIGDYTGQQPGPLVVVFGGIHGNEPAGVEALKTLFDLLQLESGHNPDFQFFGRLLALRGNRRALQTGKRFIDKDLNRFWQPQHLQELQNLPPGSSPADSEDQELLELLKLIRQTIADYRPQRMYVLDLHTTSTSGGIFTITSNQEESIRLAVQLHAPVITGILRGLSGTTLHHFTSEHYPCHTVALSFEAGQHDDPVSVQRAIAAIINLLRSVGCVRAEDVENKHDQLLMTYSAGLPKVADLVYTHRIPADSQFCMQPGYVNFQAVNAGELLAYQDGEPVYSPFDAHILMPLYQPQGEDGFFLVHPVQSPETHWPDTLLMP
jgi:succinylglutamate desuccinylase